MQLQTDILIVPCKSLPLWLISPTRTSLYKVMEVFLQIKHEVMSHLEPTSGKSVASEKTDHSLERRQKMKVVVASGILLLLLFVHKGKQR